MEWIVGGVGAFAVLALYDIATGITRANRHLENIANRLLDIENKMDKFR